VVDVFGNLVLVIEPNPAGGSDFLTSYSYSPLNQLTQVSMSRPEGTQTRTFAYTGADLTSATNPENGTVTYTYDNAHHVLTRTDARSQQTQYTYDVYGRLSQVSYGTLSGGTFTEDINQRVTYSYNTTNGRVGSTTFGRQDNQQRRTGAVADHGVVDVQPEQPGVPVSVDHDCAIPVG